MEIHGSSIYRPSPWGYAVGRRYIAHRNGDTQVDDISPIAMGIRGSSIYRPSQWGYAGRQYIAHRNGDTQVVNISPIAMEVRESSIYHPVVIRRSVRGSSIYHPSQWGYVGRRYIAHRNGDTRVVNISPIATGIRGGH